MCPRLVSPPLHLPSINDSGNDQQARWSILVGKQAALRNEVDASDVCTVPTFVLEGKLGTAIRVDRRAGNGRNSVMYCR